MAKPLQTPGTTVLQAWFPLGQWFVKPEPERRQLHGWVSPEALRGWQDFARAHHTNVTALMEALGRYLATADEQPLNRLPVFLREAIKRSQEIAGSRSSRQHRE